uniref:Uncharacterized protein n=1 Tax=Romanomermis culicivorax TaxID=13658 RepID=A0A915HJC5_ROMCU
MNTANPKSTKQQWTSPAPTEGRADYEILGAWFGTILIGLSWIVVVLTFPFSMCFCLKVVKEYERVVIFRLGRLLFG